jgi:AcrR family transcriptional regulator
MATDSRDQMLRTALDMLNQDGDLDNLKMSAITDRLDKTSGAFYGHWANLALFHADLLRYTFREHRAKHSASIREDFRDRLIGPHGPADELPDLVREFARADRDALAKDPGFRLWMSLWARRRTNPHAEQVIRDGYHDIDERWSALYDKVLHAYGLRLRDPWTPQLLSTVLTALLEGLVVRASVDPDSVPADMRDPERPDESWELFGLIVDALFPALTCPDGDERSKDDRNTWQVARESLKPQRN